MDLLSSFKLSARNVVRNRRRSLVTFLAVLIGFVALSLFEGYFMSVYDALEDQAIVGERLGHVTVVKKGFFQHAEQDPQKYSFSGAELEAATEKLKALDNVALVSPRLSLSGLISNGNSSRIYIGEGVRPEDMVALRGEKYADLPGSLKASEPVGAVMGAKLAQALGLKPGETVTLMGSTLDGLANAISVKLLEASSTGSVGTDDKYVLLPYDAVRRLQGTDGAERIVLVLKDPAQLDQTMQQVAAALTGAGMEVETRTWKEMSSYYGQVRGLFDAMYLFISVVVATVVVASVFNTMGMSIAERTREIGTLRAIGMQFGTIDWLFVLEGVLIVLGGCLVGVLITEVCALLINHSGLTYTPPDATEAVPFTVRLVGENLFGSVFTLVVLSALAAYLPARRASRKPIVEALGHV